MVYQMLFELLSKFRTEKFDIFNLLANFPADLDNLLINVSAKEVSSLSWVMSSFLYIFDQFLDSLIREILHTGYLHHHILNKILD